MPACHAGDRGFDSRRDRHVLETKQCVSSFLLFEPFLYKTLPSLGAILRNFLYTKKFLYRIAMLKIVGFLTGYV